MTDPAASQLKTLTELLQAWMDTHQPISPLDGTVSCKTCRAMVLEQNADAHGRWHVRNRDVM